MLEELKKEVLEANLKLVEYRLVTFTWGNVSALTPDRKYMVIKPSGVGYDVMKADDMVVVDLAGNKVEGDCRPSSDTDTHLEIYRRFEGVYGVTHTHSRWATIWSQMKRDLPALGTTHADTFGGAVPCTPLLTPEQLAGEYELETGHQIADTFEKRRINPIYIPAVLVASHGPFTWGKDAMDSVHNAVVLEECAMMAWHTVSMAGPGPMQPELLDKHFLRKHGPNAYYGQL